MKKTILGLVASVAVAFGNGALYDIRQATAMDFCVSVNTDYSVCLFADKYMGALEPLIDAIEKGRELVAKGAKAEEIEKVSKEVEEASKQFAKEVKKSCNMWGLLGYRGRKFASELVYQFKNGELIRFISAEEMDKVCQK